MAYKDSEELKSDERYALGKYSFRVERSSGTSPNYDKIEAICTKDGKNARKSIQVDSRTQLCGWYVEANSDTADVYVLVKVPDSGGESGEHTSGYVTGPVVSGSYYRETARGSDGVYQVYSSDGICFITNNRVWWVSSVYGTTITETSYSVNREGQQSEPRYFYFQTTQAVTHEGKTAYYTSTNIYGNEPVLTPTPTPSEYGLPADMAWTVLYGMDVDPDPEYETKEMLVGRFAIELEDAGGTGPDSGWVDPGDWPDDWEPDDPTYTLNVEIDGALSGRHNDPLNDTSYSYIPADKDTVKDYGCGGDGGNGGGGGAGASSIVVYKFATNKANSKEIVCKPKRHGYGSGGGKGGKGGDGCILIYY